MHKTAASRDLTASLPQEYLLQRPWRLDRLKELPQEELKAWYDNLEAGRTLKMNEIRVTFIIDGKSHAFDITPKGVYLPDGEFHHPTGKDEMPVSRLRDAGQKDCSSEEILIKDPFAYMKTVLKSRVKDGDSCVPNTTITKNTLIEGAVDSFSGTLETFGVERLGCFVEEFGRLRHKALESPFHFTSNLDKIGIDYDFIYWDERLHVTSSPPNGKPDYILYHMHPQDGKAPSLPDLKNAIKLQQPSIIIATKNGEGYDITEWRPKEGADLKALARGASKLPTVAEKQRVIEENFETKEYTLEKQGDTITYAAKPA